MKNRKYKTEALMVIHQSMEDLYKLGLATDEEMHEFDEGCLVAEPEPSAFESSGSRSKPVIPAVACHKG